MEEGEVVLASVENITNTVVTVKLENGKEGLIVSSEIAPGRIKNIREYVAPNKKIVCKILEISGDRINLSLRRVSSKEKKEVMEKFRQEQAVNVAFKQLLGGKAEETKKKILADFESLSGFIGESKQNEKLIEKYIPKDKQEAIKKITQKKKVHELSYNIQVTCLEEDGLARIKKILDVRNEKISIIYISAGNFKMKFSVEDFKEGRKEIGELIGEMGKKAKENNCEFSATEEK